MVFKKQISSLICHDWHNHFFFQMIKWSFLSFSTVFYATAVKYYDIRYHDSTNIIRLQSCSSFCLKTPSMISDLPVVQCKLEEWAQISLITVDLKNLIILETTMQIVYLCLFINKVSLQKCIESKYPWIIIVPDSLKRSSIPAPQCVALYEGESGVTWLEYSQCAMYDSDKFTLKCSVYFYSIISLLSFISVTL